MPASAGERMQQCWDKVFAARDSVKEIQLKVEKNVKAMQNEAEKAVGLDKPAPDKPKLGLGSLLRKSTSALEASRKVLRRQNATEQLLVNDSARTESRTRLPPPASRLPPSILTPASHPCPNPQPQPQPHS